MGGQVIIIRKEGSPPSKNGNNHLPNLGNTSLERFLQRKESNVSESKTRSIRGRENPNILQVKNQGLGSRIFQRFP